MPLRAAFDGNARFTHAASGRAYRKTCRKTEQSRTNFPCMADTKTAHTKPGHNRYKCLVKVASHESLTVGTMEYDVISAKANHAAKGEGANISLSHSAQPRDTPLVHVRQLID